MHIIHQGFDGLDFSIEANVRHAISDKLKVGQDRAKETKQAQLVTFGDAELHVTDSGMKGGYAYRLDTGPLGYTLAIKEPRPTDPWGIFVSIKSTPLAILGWEECVERVFADLRALGIIVREEMVSMTRVDYAVDLLLGGFELDRERLVTHSKMKWGRHEAITENGQGGEATGLRIGRIRNKQVAIYDKRLDVIAKRKTEWWEIWNRNLAMRGFPPICVETSKGRIWRFELRAGKDYLKEKWGIRTFADFRARVGDAFLKICTTVRYTEPCGDMTRSRWALSPEWALVTTAIENDLVELISGVSESFVKQVHREQLIDTLDAQIMGCLISQAHALALPTDDLAQTVSAICARYEGAMGEDLALVEEKLAQAGERYAFLDA